MPRTKTITLYTYDELPDERAKARARDWYRQGISEDFDTEFVYEDAATIAGMLGLDIHQRGIKLMDGTTTQRPAICYSGFSSQGDGACFDGNWSAGSVRAGAVKEHAPQDAELHRIADTFERIARENPEGTFRVRHSGHYYHSLCTSFDFGGDLNSEHEEELKESARALMDWIYSQLEKEWDDRNSDESVTESIIANEYTFTADGVRAD